MHGGRWMTLGARMLADSTSSIHCRCSGLPSGHQIKRLLLLALEQPTLYGLYGVTMEHSSMALKHRNGFLHSVHGAPLLPGKAECRAHTQPGGPTSMPNWPILAYPPSSRSPWNTTLGHIDTFLSRCRIPSLEGGMSHSSKHIPRVHTLQPIRRPCLPYTITFGHLVVHLLISHSPPGPVSCQTS